MEVVELLPLTRVRWRCVEGPDEWIGTTITFELKATGDETTLLFTHAGWREPVEFMQHCSTKWGYFLLGPQGRVRGRQGHAVAERHACQQLGMTTMADFRIERDIVIEAPVEVVWRTVTEPDQIAQWFANRVELDATPGGAGVFVFEDKEGNVTHTAPLVVETVEPPTLVLVPLVSP